MDSSTQVRGSGESRIAWPRPRWIVLPVASICIGAVLSAQVIWLDLEDLPRAARFAALQTWPWLVLAPLVWWFACRVWVNGQTWRWALPVHGLACVGTVAAYALLWSLPGRMGWLGPGPDRFFAVRAGAVRGAWAERPPADGPPRWPGRPEAGRRVERFEGDGEPGRPFPMLARRVPGPWMLLLLPARSALPVYLVLVAGAHAFVYYRRGLEREKRALQAEAGLAQARLRALQSQLQPHFLFNTLNAVSALVYARPQEADRMLCELSELLRQVLAWSDRTEVALEEEMELLGKYLAIQSIRFSDRLAVERQMDGRVGRAAVPPLILQPLVENAVRHGIARHDEPGRIVLSAWPENEMLVMTVTDSVERTPATGPAGPVVMKLGHGLANTQERLRTLYGERFRFEATALREAVGMVVRLEIPLRQLEVVP